MRLTHLMYSSLFTLLFACACSSDDRLKKLEVREKEVTVKEQELHDWEQRLRSIENDLAKKERIIDSLNGKTNPHGIYNPALIGNWNVSMECTETNCEGSAIGDTKTEQWNIYYQGNRVIAKAMADKRPIRTYAGEFKENSLTLSAVQTPTPETHMDVVLSPHSTKANLLEGERVINQGGKCRIVYRLKAEKL